VALEERSANRNDRGKKGEKRRTSLTYSSAKVRKGEGGHTKGKKKNICYRFVRSGRGKKKPRGSITRNSKHFRSGEGKEKHTPSLTVITKGQICREQPLRGGMKSVTSLRVNRDHLFFEKDCVLQRISDGETGTPLARTKGEKKQGLQDIFGREKKSSSYGREKEKTRWMNDPARRKGGG